VVEKNLVYGTVVADDVTYMVNGLFLTSNVVLIPNHYFVSDSLDVTFRKCNPDASGGKFATRLSRCQSVHIPGSDFSLCYSSTGGSFKNIVKYLPESIPSKHDFNMLWRKKDGSMLEASGLAVPAHTGNGVAMFDGLKYQSLTMNTFKG
jgi:hypothetical protein